MDIKEIREKTVDGWSEPSGSCTIACSASLSAGNEPIENPGQIRLVRKELARVKTIINEKRRLTPRRVLAWQRVRVKRFEGWGTHV